LYANEVHAVGARVTKVLFFQWHATTLGGLQEPTVGLFIEAVGSAQSQALVDVFEARDLNFALPRETFPKPLGDIPHLLIGTGHDARITVTGHVHTLVSHVADTRVALGRLLGLFRRVAGSACLTPSLSLRSLLILLCSWGTHDASFLPGGCL
jgi:hypothetical protein